MRVLTYYVKIEHYLRHENKVNGNKVSSFCEALRYMLHIRHILYQNVEICFTVPCADQFVLVNTAPQYPDKNTCPQVGRKDPPHSPLECKHYACKESSANVVATMPSGGWCQFRICPNTNSIPFTSEPAGHTWETYAKRP